jgi:hypothetical protein
MPADPVVNDLYPSSYELRPPEPDIAYGVPELIQGECDWIEQFTGEIDREQEYYNMVYKSLSLQASTDKTYKCVVKDRQLNPVNVYGGVGVLSLKKLRTDTAYVFQKHTNVPAEGSLGDPTQGELLFYVVPADTDALEERQYLFDVKVTLSNGKTYTVAEGTINLHKSINI